MKLGVPEKVFPDFWPTLNSVYHDFSRRVITVQNYKILALLYLGVSGA